MNDRCSICRGRGSVTLPVYRDPAFVETTAEASAGEGSRTYPCPQCSRHVPEDRIGAVLEHSEIALSVEDVGRFREAVYRDIAHRIAQKMLAEGLISFDEIPPLTYAYWPGRSGRITGTIGVVKPAIVASMEERISERQIMIARRVVKQATREILEDPNLDNGWIDTNRAVRIMERVLDTHERMSGVDLDYWHKGVGRV